MEAQLHDARLCKLGEGPLWHPEREQLFWFDILAQKLLSRRGEETLEWNFDRPVSAAAWIDHDTLLIAGAGTLMRFDVTSGHREQICPLESDRPGNRSNDGRADPWGGFWIGTMGRSAEPGAGAIGRYYRGELRELFGSITIPNSISFTPDGRFAHFSDTHQRLVWRQRLGKGGWPTGEPEIYLDLRAQKTNPDGAVCDAEGFLWLACWGNSHIARYTPDGHCHTKLALPVEQPSCPAFGGADFTTLYVTSARDGLQPKEEALLTMDGATFSFNAGVSGLREPSVTL